MFSKKDYISYFNQLYQVELNMKKEGQDLLKLIPDGEAQILLKKLVADEIRHAKIVKGMIALM